MQLFKIQCEWYSLSVLVLVLSFGSWIGVAYIVSSSTAIDYDYYFVSAHSFDFLCSWDHTTHLALIIFLARNAQTWSRLLQTGTFWLCLLVLVTMVSIKDLFIVGMQRAFTTDPRLILQEVLHNLDSYTLHTPP